MVSPSQLAAARHRTTEEIKQTGTLGIVRRANGGKTKDPTTLVETPTFDDVYTGPAKVRFPSGTTTKRKGPGIVALEQSVVLSLPIGEAGAGDVTTGDVWECTANPLDPSLVGRQLRITGLHSQSAATAHRFPVIETT